MTKKNKYLINNEFSYLLLSFHLFIFILAGNKETIVTEKSLNVSYEKEPEEKKTLPT